MTQTARIPKIHQERWHDPKTFATTLLLLYVDHFGGADPDKRYDCLAWDPVTIENELADDFGPIRPANFDRLMAAISIVTSDNFFRSLPDFIPLCNVLSGDTFDPRVFDPADVMECAWGIAEATILVTKEEGPGFDEEIVAYLEEICQNEGMIAPPTILRLSTKRDYPAAFNQIAGQFSDDPDMFAAIAEVEHLKTDEVNSRVKDGLRALFSQLNDTPLANGSTADIASKALARLRSLTQLA